MIFTPDSKIAASRELQSLSKGIDKTAPNEFIALNCAAMSIFYGLSDEGIKAFSKDWTDAEKAATCSELFPHVITELITTWWEDPKMTTDYPFLTALHISVSGDDQIILATVDWSFIYQAYIEAGKQLIEA